MNIEVTVFQYSSLYEMNNDIIIEIKSKKGDPKQ